MSGLTSMICVALLVSCRQTPAPPAAAPQTTTATSSVEAPVTDRPILYECDEDICSIERNGRRRRALVEAPGTQYLAQWAPDGRSFSYLDVAERGADLWVARRDGSHTTRVARNVDEFYDWAPDSERLIVSRSTFIDYTLGFDSDLYVVGADGSGRSQLTDSDLSESMPVWSPDGGTIAFTGAARTGTDVNLDIYVLDVATGDTERLTTDPAHDQEPRWSPDGSKLAFLTARHDPYDSEEGPYTSALYVVEVGSGAETRLTRGDRTTDMEHDWSPDGEALVYKQGFDDDVADGEPTIRVVTLAGDITRLVPGNEPAWSPDGRFIAFSRDGRDAELYRIRPDGAAEEQLTHNRTHDSRPSW